MDWTEVHDSYGPALAIPALLDVVEMADDRQALARAIWELQDRTTYQGGAVAEAAVPAVAAVVRLIERGSDPSWWLAETISYLDVIARALGAWSRALSRSGKPESYAPKVQWESGVGELLRSFQATCTSLVRSADAEVRAMASELLADITTDADATVRTLQAAVDIEQHALTRACMAESIIRAASSSASDAVKNDIHNWAEVRLGDEEGIVRFRTARAILEFGVGPSDPAERTVEDDEAMIEMVWPAEV